MDELQKQIAAAVRTLRKQRNWTQEQLAAKSGRSLDAISNIERGVNKPSLKTIGSLAKGFDISVAELFQATGYGSETRTNLMTSLLDVVRSLDDRTLTVAVKQLQDLAALSKAKR